MSSEEFQLKFCKDCKHCRPDWFASIITLGYIQPYDYAKCNRPGRENLVSGAKETTYCSVERMTYIAIDNCGENAKYWEAMRKID